MLRNSMTFILITTVLAVLMTTNLVTADPSSQSGWSEKVITNGFAFAEGAYWCGPVIANLQPDNSEKEVVVAFNTNTESVVKVYDFEGTEIELDPPIEIPENIFEAGYRIRSIPSVGDINGDGNLDIVFTCNHDSTFEGEIDHQHYGHTHRTSEMVCVSALLVYLYDGVDGGELLISPCFGTGIGDNSFDETPYIDAETPALADLDVLEFDPQSPTYEDGRMEIVLAGYCREYEILGYFDQDHPEGNGVDPGNPDDENYWNEDTFGFRSLIVIQLNSEDELVVRSSQSIVIECEVPLNPNGLGLQREQYLIPAVGDINPDGCYGKKEVAVSFHPYLKCWTYDPAAANPMENANDLLFTINTHAIDEGIYAFSPVLADLNNDEYLEIIAPVFLGFNTLDSKILAIKPDGSPIAGWGMQGFSVLDDIGVNPGQNLIVMDNGNDGALDVLYHTRFWQWINNEETLSGRLYCYKPNTDQFDIGDASWPKFLGIDEFTDGGVLTAGHIQIGNNAVKCFMPAEEDGNDVFGFDNPTSDDPVFSWDVSGQTGYSSAVLTDIDNDSDYEVAVSSINGENLIVKIWDLDDGYDLNENVDLEWAQLSNGPRHTGLYAQSCEFALPLGHSWFRDRVIITDDCLATSDLDNCFIQGGPASGNRYLTITDNTVIEFNNNVCLSFLGEGRATFGENLVFKGNSPTDGFRIFVTPGCSINHSYFENGGIFVYEPEEEGGQLFFENVTFSGGGSGTTFSATGVEVNFTNCTFTGYDNAVILDSCTGSIVNCTFEDCDNNAIKLIDCTGSFSIKECQISGVGEAAIYLYNSNPDIEECEIFDNDCGTYGSAIYAYNSTPHLRDNYIHDNEYSGFKAMGGGYPRFTTYALGDPHGNFLEDNNLYSHTPRADSTWGEMIIMSPTYLCIDKGHNDISNIAGDYLISNWSAGSATVSASYNYWVTPVSLGSDDFYPTSSVNYAPEDPSANYVSDFNDDTEAEELFARATQQADSGLYQAADQGLRSIISTYPTTHVAHAALRMIKDIGPAMEISQASLQRYFTDVAENNEALQVYADRLANLCLVDARVYGQAIRNYNDVLEDVDNRNDSLYYAIDRAYAVIAQLRNEEGNLDAVDRNGNNAAIDEVENQIRRMMADLNGMPLPKGLTERKPEEFVLTACYPNPFNSTITISYKLPEANRVMVGVYDLNGREVVRLTDDVQNAGQHTLTWNADNCSSGVYLVRVETLGKVDSRKIVLCK